MADGARASSADEGDRARAIDGHAAGDEAERGSEPGEASDAGSVVASSADEAAPSDDQPPLPTEEAPPLPDEAPPGERSDDGWEPVWDPNAQSYYFYNRITQATQWENPRVPETTAGTAPLSSTSGLGAHDRIPGATNGEATVKRVAGGYNPAIHGDYDPTADYAIEAQAEEEERRREEAAAASSVGGDPAQMYEATGHFNRFTGRWQADSLNPDNHNDESKSRRQMHAFFDVDAAANSHEGRSLKAERSGKKLSKAELKMYQERRRNKKEEKRRAWLRD